MLNGAADPRRFWVLAATSAWALGAADARAEILQRVPLVGHPRAVCNNGKPASFYFSGRVSKSWLLYLDGGGGCVTRRECDSRWIRSHEENMEGDTAPSAVAKAGIFNRAMADNPVRDWNMVYVRYCSSDEWIGGGGSMASGSVARNLPGAPAPARYVFHGADIFDAVVAHLRHVGIPDGAGGVSRLEDTSATTVLLAGHSAGGKGTMNNILRLEEKLTNAQKFYVVDAYFHGLDAGLAQSDDHPEFRPKAVYAPKLSNRCNRLRCLVPAVVHGWFRKKGLRVLYGFAERDPVIGEEARNNCFAVTYPYQGTCQGGPGPGAAAQKTRVIAQATPARQHAGWHPDASQHVMLPNDTWFYGTLVGGASYARAVRELLTGSPAIYVAP